MIKRCLLSEKAFVNMLSLSKSHNPIKYRHYLSYYVRVLIYIKLSSIEAHSQPSSSIRLEMGRDYREATLIF